MKEQNPQAKELPITYDAIAEAHKTYCDGRLKEQRLLFEIAYTIISKLKTIGKIPRNHLACCPPRMREFDPVKRYSWVDAMFWDNEARRYEASFVLTVVHQGQTIPREFLAVILTLQPSQEQVQIGLLNTDLQCNINRLGSKADELKIEEFANLILADIKTFYLNCLDEVTGKHNKRQIGFRAIPGEISANK